MLLKGSPIKDVADPADAQDVATKAYVDANSGGGGGSGPAFVGFATKVDDYTLVLADDKKVLFIDSSAKTVAGEIRVYLPDGMPNGYMVRLAQKSQTWKTIPLNIIGLGVAQLDNTTNFFNNYGFGEDPFIDLIFDSAINKFRQFRPNPALYTVNGLGDLIMYQPMNMGGNLISAVSDPVDDQDVATKAYVDANAGGGALFTNFVDWADNLTIPQGTTGTVYFIDTFSFGAQVQVVLPDLATDGAIIRLADKIGAWASFGLYVLPQVGQTIDGAPDTEVGFGTQFVDFIYNAQTLTWSQFRTPTAASGDSFSQISLTGGGIIINDSQVQYRKAGPTTFDLQTVGSADDNGLATAGILISTGNKNAGTANSGSISIETGLSLGGTRGEISLQARQVNVNSQKIVGLAAPTADTDAANKAYVNLRVDEGPIGVVQTQFTDETLTAVPNNVWANFTNNAVTLSAGIWELSGTVAFYGSAAYTSRAAGFHTENGGGNAANPESLSAAGILYNNIVSNVFQYFSDASVSNEIITMPTVLVAVFGDTDIFLNTKTTNGTPAGTEIKVVLAAKRLAVFPVA